MYPSDVCPIYAAFFSSMGCSFAIVFSVLGAAYGTAKAGIGISASAVLHPDNIIRNSVPVIMAGILSIYGLVVAVMIGNSLKPETHIFTGFVHTGAGIAVGLCGLGAGFAIGITGDVGVRATVQQPRMFVGMMLIQIFAEVLGLYGMIVALIMLSSTANISC